MLTRSCSFELRVSSDIYVTACIVFHRDGEARGTLTSRAQGSSSIILKFVFFNAHPLPSRPATSGTAEHSPPDSAGGNDRKGSLRRGLAWPLEGRERRREDLQLARGEVLVQGGRDLSDGDAQARQHPRVHRC